MSQKFYLTILRIGVYLSFLVIFFTFRSLLFPYISSKQIPFNILMEVLFVFWLALIIKYPSWRPKKSWITFGLIAFFAACFISCFTGVDFNLSFWGDVERMLGVFHLFHFLIFYLIIITIMRTWQDWRNLLLVSVSVAVLVSLYGIGQRLGVTYSPWGKDRIISTIGNAAYVGSYAIFNIYFALILLVKAKDAGAKMFYGSAIFIIFLALLFSGTRGAYLGFGSSVILMLFLFGVLRKNKKIRNFVFSSALLIIVVISFLLANANKPWVKNNPDLFRMTHISFTDATMQTRLISWRAAWRDFPNHPILGTGYGNYAITFDKYFDPKFYTYTSSETYFDRAHNNIIDIASTTGLLGLVTYLSIFAAVVFYIIKGWRSGKIELADFILLTCFLVAYFVQNLVVFDALVTYIALMIMLGYVNWLYKNEEAPGEKDLALTNKEALTLFLAGLTMLTVMYQYNIKPLEMLVWTINGQKEIAKNNILGVVDAYKKALSYQTPLDGDSRTTFIRSIAQVQGQMSQIDKNKANEIYDYAISLAQANLKDNENDSMNQLILAQIANSAAVFNASQKEKFDYYSQMALEAIDKSITLSPGRVTNFFIKAQIYLTRGEQQKAIDTMKYAISLEDKYYEGYCHLARVLISYNIIDEGYKNIDKCIELGGVSTLQPANFVRLLINHYIEKQDWDKTLSLFSTLASQEPQNAQNYVELSKLYKLKGDKENSIKSAQKAMELDPNLKESAQKFIDSLR